jgi:hypothetical protein
MSSSEIMNVIDSINLEHDGRPKTASHFFGALLGHRGRK